MERRAERRCVANNAGNEIDRDESVPQGQEHVHTSRNCCDRGGITREYGGDSQQPDCYTQKDRQVKHGL